MESEGNQTKKGNIGGVSELIRVAAGLLTHHLCHRLCRARDKAQRVCLGKELVIESNTWDKGCIFRRNKAPSGILGMPCCHFPCVGFWSF